MSRLAMNIAMSIFVININSVFTGT